MHFLSYRKRMLLRKLTKYFCISIASVGFIVLFYLSFMDRYVVYNRQGAYVDTVWEKSIVHADDKQLLSVVPKVTELAPTSATSSSVRKLSGCYVNIDMLTDLNSVKQMVDSAGYSTVLIEVKGVDGTFYYNTSVAEAVKSSVVDYSAVSAWIRELKNKGVYLIASIPAFADRNYCLNHIQVGLPLAGGALWMDSNGAYWMDPGNNSTVLYLESICTELANMGFQEVLLRDYYIPTNSSIVYNESSHTRSEALASCAQIVQADMGTMDLKVSFGLELSSGFPISISEGRLYFKSNDPNMAATYINNYRQNVISTEVQIVFLSASDDAAFGDTGKLVPVIANKGY